MLKVKISKKKLHERRNTNIETLLTNDPNFAHSLLDSDEDIAEPLRTPVPPHSIDEDEEDHASVVLAAVSVIS